MEDKKPIQNKTKKKAPQKYKIAVEDIAGMIDDALALEKAGKKAESDALVESLKEKLREMLDDSEPYAEETVDVANIRKNLPKAGEILAENNRVLLKMISAEEYSSYVGVFYESDEDILSFDEERFKKEYWDSFLSDYCIGTSIYDKNSGEFVGYCSVNDIRLQKWELSIEEKSEFRNKGYGFAALSLFIHTVSELTNNRSYRARVDIDNIPSQKLFKKLGAFPSGICEYKLHGEDLINFQRDNRGLIDDNIRNLAKEFNVKPEELIGHVLEYKIDVF